MPPRRDLDPGVRFGAIQIGLQGYGYEKVEIREQDILPDNSALRERRLKIDYYDV